MHSSASGAEKKLRPMKATAAESRYMERVASLRCVLCVHLGFDQGGRTYCHHIKEGTGIGERSQHWLVVSLCHEHHQGASGIHGLGTKGFYLRYRMDELDLLAMTLRALDGARDVLPERSSQKARAE